ncbi:MAG: MmcQ/YjbR family DNA-binding protein [Gammaproteobacteria bacterium]
MAKDINQAVCEVCVRGKTFATYVVNHHGDDRVALWLNASAGAQEHYTRSEARHFFVPPYVGPRGWLGVSLTTGLSWKRIAALVRQAYEKVAPTRLIDTIGKTIEISPPKEKLSPSQIDPMQSPRAQRALKPLRKVAYYLGDRLKVAFWVGLDQQGLLTADSRYEIPAYMGHNGWIALDVTEKCDWDEVRACALDSYRHFALKRMRSKLVQSASWG